MNFGPIVVVALLVVFMVWMTGIGRPRPVPAPEDDIHTPIDEEALGEAERDLAASEDAAPLGENGDDDDDWGPGAGGRSPLPGIL